MTKICFGLYFLLSLTVFSTPGLAASEMPRPVINKDRKFLVQDAAPVVAIETPYAEIKLFAFEKALQRCGLSSSLLASQMRTVLAPQSALWLSLQPLFPTALTRLRDQGLQILIDDFSDFEGGRPAFTSYFLLSPMKTIGLDCSSRAQAYWVPSLAHEITHALLAESGHESWWEEGLAQMNERQAGGKQPEITLQSLSRAPMILDFRDTRRPLDDQQSYAMSFLFARYVFNAFGGWATLRAMAAPVAISEDYLETLSARGAQSLASRSSVLGASKLTRSGLLRFFYMALAMKDARDPSYVIQGWQGFDQIYDFKTAVRLKPGQALISASLNETWSSEVLANYEVYQVFQGAHGEHLIVPQVPFVKSPAPTFASVRSFFVLINTQK